MPKVYRNYYNIFKKFHIVYGKENHLCLTSLCDLKLTTKLFLSIKIIQLLQTIVLCIFAIFRSFQYDFKVF